jgi:hypothetical protein
MGKEEIVTYSEIPPQHLPERHEVYHEKPVRIVVGPVEIRTGHRSVTV